RERRARRRRRRRAGIRGTGFGDGNQVECGEGAFHSRSRGSDSLAEQDTANLAKFSQPYQELRASYRGNSFLTRRESTNGEYAGFGIGHESCLFIQTDQIDYDRDTGAFSRRRVECAVSVGANHGGADAARADTYGESGTAVGSAHNDSWRVEVQPGRQRRSTQEARRFQRSEWRLRPRTHGRRVPRRRARRIRQAERRERRRASEDARTVHAGKSDHAFDDGSGSGSRG